MYYDIRYPNNKGGEKVKKRKLKKSIKTSKFNKKFSEELIFGLEKDFILITGGGFLVVVMGLFILFK